jgi:hypothetical protein
MDLRSRIDDISRTILIGLREAGKTKTFSQILQEGRIPFNAEHLFDVANQLEALDLIRSVSFQLPVAIRAELTAQGYALVRTFNVPDDDAKLRRHITGMSDKNLSVFL